MTLSSPTLKINKDEILLGYSQTPYERFSIHVDKKVGYISIITGVFPLSERISKWLLD